MWDFRRINRKKEELCMREGIDESRQAEFREMGDASPLYRYVIYYRSPAIIIYTYLSFVLTDTLSK